MQVSRTNQNYQRPFCPSHLLTMKTYKARIVLVGPCGSGKSVLANYLSDLNIELIDDLKPTRGLRIAEYDINNAQVDGVPANIDVQVWDTSGDDKFMPYWSIFRRCANGIVFVYNSSDETSPRKLDYMFNYFVTQRNMSLRSCLVCCLGRPENIQLCKYMHKSWNYLFLIYQKFIIIFFWS